MSPLSEFTSEPRGQHITLNSSKTVSKGRSGTAGTDPQNSIIPLPLPGTGFGSTTMLSGIRTPAEAEILVISDTDAQEPRTTAYRGNH